MLHVPVLTASEAENTQSQNRLRLTRKTTLRADMRVFDEQLDHVSQESTSVGRGSSHEHRPPQPLAQAQLGSQSHPALDGHGRSLGVN